MMEADPDTDIFSEDLYNLLEQAASRATGRDDTDISEYVSILQDEWIMDVDALRRLEPAALDELLPLLYSQELQRLVHNQKTKGKNTLSLFGGRNRWRGRAPPRRAAGVKVMKQPEKDPAPYRIVMKNEKSSLDSLKPKKDKEDRRKCKSSAPPAMIPIAEEESLSSSSMSSASANKEEDGDCLAIVLCPSVVTEPSTSTDDVPQNAKSLNYTPKSPSSKKIAEDKKQQSASRTLSNSKSDSKCKSSTKKKKKNKTGQLLFKVLDFLELSCAYDYKDDVCCNDDSVVDDKEEPNKFRMNASPTVNARGEAGIGASNSDSNPLNTDHHHGSRQRDIIIARAKKRFPTREALEDSIAELQLCVLKEKEQAKASADDKTTVSNIMKKPLSSAAEDELRQLYPLRLILPTLGDLTEMIQILQSRRENDIRNLNMHRALKVREEIDQLQDQIDEEERYLLRKKLGEAECVACGVTFVPKTFVEAGKMMKKKDGYYCEKCREVFGSYHDQKLKRVMSSRVMPANTNTDASTVDVRTEAPLLAFEKSYDDFEEEIEKMSVVKRILSKVISAETKKAEEVKTLAAEEARKAEEALWESEIRTVMFDQRSCLDDEGEEDDDEQEQKRRSPDAISLESGMFPLAPEWGVKEKPKGCGSKAGSKDGSSEREISGDGGSLVSSTSSFTGGYFTGGYFTDGSYGSFSGTNSASISDFGSDDFEESDYGSASVRSNVSGSARSIVLPEVMSVATSVYGVRRRTGRTIPDGVIIKSDDAMSVETSVYGVRTVAGKSSVNSVETSLYNGTSRTVLGKSDSVSVETSLFGVRTVSGK